MWIYVGLIVASLAISYYVQSKMEKPKPAALSDFDMPVPDEGTPQCVVFGDCWISDWQVLSFGNLRTRKIKTRGGK